MADTQNLKMFKPGTDDTVGVESSLNGNFEIIDSKLGNGLTDQKGKEWTSLGERLNAEGTTNDDTAKKVAVLVEKVPNAILDDARIRSIVNRGASSQAPENTPAAFKAAVDMGYWGIYTSVQRTSDGKWVCIHDTTVDRTSNGTGAVSSKTLGTLNGLDFGSWYSTTFVDTRIATLQIFLKICRLGGVIPYVEIKGGSYTDLQIKEVIDIMKDYGFANGGAITSYNLEYLQKVRIHDKQIALGYMCPPSSFTQADVDAAKALGNSFISAAQSTINSTSMKRAAGMRVEAYTVNDNNALRNIFDLGVLAAMTTRIPFGRGY